MLHSGRQDFYEGLTMQCYVGKTYDEHESGAGALHTAEGCTCGSMASACPAK